MLLKWNLSETMSFDDQILVELILIQHRYQYQGERQIFYGKWTICQSIGEHWKHLCHSIKYTVTVLSAKVKRTKTKFIQFEIQRNGKWLHNKSKHLVKALFETLLFDCYFVFYWLEKVIYFHIILYMYPVCVSLSSIYFSIELCQL